MLCRLGSQLQAIAELQSVCRAARVRENATFNQKKIAGRASEINIQETDVTK